MYINAFFKPWMIGGPIRNKSGDAKMDSVGFPTRVIAVILLLAAPAGILHALSYFYNNPYLQPYDLDWKGFASSGEELGFARIDVHVNWGRDWTGATTKEELYDVIAGKLKIRTEFYRVEFIDLPGTQVDVTFIVGSNRYGPFAPNQMAAGIAPAVMALKMTAGPRR